MLISPSHLIWANEIIGFSQQSPVQLSKVLRQNEKCIRWPRAARCKIASGERAASYNTHARCFDARRQRSSESGVCNFSPIVTLLCICVFWNGRFAPRGAFAYFESQTRLFLCSLTPRAPTADWMRSPPLAKWWWFAANCALYASNKLHTNCRASERANLATAPPSIYYEYARSHLGAVGETARWQN